MIFLEVEDLTSYWSSLKAKELDKHFAHVKYIDPKDFDWGSEGFLYDPSGILWLIGSFKH